MITLFVVKHKFESLPIISSYKLVKRGEFFIDKDKKHYLLLMNNKGKDLSYLKLNLEKLKPDIIINFGIAGLLSEKYPLNTLIMVKDFYLLDENFTMKIESIKNKFIISKLTQESSITIHQVNEKLDREYLSNYGIILDMEVYFYKKIAMEIPFFSIKFISDYNKDLDKINLKELRNRLIQSKENIYSMVNTIKKEIKNKKNEK